MKDFCRGLVFGFLLFGSPLLGVRCFSVQPAHASDTEQRHIESELVKQTSLMREQIRLLERIAKASERCK